MVIHITMTDRIIFLTGSIITVVTIEMVTIIMETEGSDMVTTITVGTDTITAGDM